MSPDAAPARCVVVLPVKPPAFGKSRLTGLPDEQRRELAEAFARDTARAAVATVGVAAVLVVTDDFRLAASMRARGCEYAAGPGRFPWPCARTCRACDPTSSAPCWKRSSCT
jgi:hypothetical protein